ncbi:hypothetical protein [Aliarcobacter butzleri]|uniref:hypothetical protein n=1 Tax=Aliarcobacter butzleri TaxID=28197 RepID=UPI0021B34F08|nr:hypothetical protein [Aliarcobacter butzleri]MCT7646160.1 hypothetical protein [Aliarcobacter butzleri]MCT7647680.1 hypothetical protein [Aliarcobacter butzleri]
MKKFLSISDEYKENRDLKTYLNDILKLSENEKKEFSDKNIKDIIKIVNELNRLKKMGITSKNFIHKVKSYKQHLDNMKKDFGFIPTSNDIPFNRPTDLKIELDNLLFNTGLNPEQIKDITKELLNENTRRPKEKGIKPLFETCKTIDNKISLKNKSPYITPLMKKKYYEKITKSKDDITYLEIEITLGDLEILQKYVKENYEDYYMGSVEFYLKDLMKSLIQEIK